MTNTQKLSIRLLRDGLEPCDAVREHVNLIPWDKFEGAMIALDTLGGNVPKWASFLELSEEKKKRVHNRTAFGLVFVQTEDRWFAVSFGMGHVKLDTSAFEQGFGLRVVLNAVDPRQLKSADVRAPDENTLLKRLQTSYGSDQTALAIDIEHDIIFGLAGICKDASFGSFVAGTDALTLNRKLDITMLPQVCSEVLVVFQKSDYRENFGWIDQIHQIREKSLIDDLNAELVKALAKAVNAEVVEDIHLAFPVIYNPERQNLIRYKGFRSRINHINLDLTGYLDSLKERGKTDYTNEDLSKHKVHEVDEDGRDCGSNWKLRDCIVFETEFDGSKYVLSGGNWYRIDQDLAKEVQEFFDKTTKIDLPKAEPGENEEKYNRRIAELEAENMICLDRKCIKPTDAADKIEVCDFLDRKRLLIHVKHKNHSCRLSHLFNQGTVSARVLATDSQFRNELRKKIEDIQAETGQTGYESIIPRDGEEFVRSDFTVVYGVIPSSNKLQLPFFSLVSFRQAARDLDALGYERAFAWL